MSMSEMPSSSFVNDPDTDITIQSRDRIKFHLQRKYLSINTGAFPGDDFETRGEITHLTEPSAVLDVLFQFVYPKKHPTLEDLDFPLVSAIAEAAEKYEVFAAMSVCSIRMKLFLPENAADILAYGARHDYPHLMTVAAPHLAQLPLDDVVGKLPMHCIQPWVRYYGCWKRVFEDALKPLKYMQVLRPNQVPIDEFDSGTPWVCYACLYTIVIAIKELENLTSLKSLDEAVAKPPVKPRCCQSKHCEYKKIWSQIRRDISAKMKQLPPFGKFLEK